MEPSATQHSTTGSSVISAPVVIGLAREYRKLGRLITAKDFGILHDLLDNP